MSVFDPIISASEETKGCSDDKLFLGIDAGCFGTSKLQQTRSGKILIIVGGVLILVELVTLFIVMSVYVYQKRRVNTRISMSNSLEDIFTPSSLDELVLMHSPHVDEIREMEEERKYGQ